MECSVCNQDKKHAVKYKGKFYCSGCDKDLLEVMVKKGDVQEVSRPVTLYYHHNGEYLGNGLQHAEGEIIENASEYIEDFEEVGDEN